MYLPRFPVAAPARRGFRHSRTEHPNPVSMPPGWCQEQSVSVGSTSTKEVTSKGLSLIINLNCCFCWWHCLDAFWESRTMQALHRSVWTLNWHSRTALQISPQPLKRIHSDSHFSCAEHHQSRWYLYNATRIPIQHQEKNKPKKPKKPNPVWLIQHFTNSYYTLFYRFPSVNRISRKAFKIPSQSCVISDLLVSCSGPRQHYFSKFEEPLTFRRAFHTCIWIWSLRIWLTSVKDVLRSWIYIPHSSATQRLVLWLMCSQWKP